MSENNFNTHGWRLLSAVSGWITLLIALCVVIECPAAGIADKTVIADKTLVAWVAPANLTQRGGSVLTIEKSGGVFDAIVFGELAVSKWMAGSNGFGRTEKEQGSYAAETATTTRSSRSRSSIGTTQITIYRNGSKYADYTAGSSERFGNDSIVLMGSAPPRRPTRKPILHRLD